MKKLILVIAIIFTTFCFGQKPSVDVIFYNDKTTTERDAITVDLGKTAVVYNITTGQLEFSTDGITWDAVSGAGGGAAQLDELTDVISAANTNRFALLGNGTTGYVGRALVISDISDFTDNSTTWDALVSNVITDLTFSVAPTTVTVISSDGTDAVLPEANTTNAGILGSDKWDEIVANTLKATNVTTNLSLGTVTATTMDVNSSDGTNATLIEADTDDAGLLGAAKWDEIVANTAKSTNVSTALSTGTVTATTYGITSDGGADDVVLVEATTVVAGLLGSAKWNEIVANTLKVTNVSTNLSIGTVDGTQYIINSSDGTNVSLPLADTNNWGIVSDEIFDDIVANTAKITNNDQTLANTNDATSHTVTLSDSGGSVRLIEGSNITLTTAGTGLDGTVTIASSGGGESTTVSDTAEIDLTLATFDITADIVTGSVDVLKLDSGVQTSLGLADTSLQSEVDGSITNEGDLTVGAGIATTSLISSNTSGSTDITITAGTNMGISEVGNVITLTSTDQFLGTVTDVTGGAGVSSTGGTTPSIALTVDELSEKTGALVGTDRLVGTTGTTNWTETISGIPLGIFNDDLGHTENIDHTGDVTSSGAATTIAVDAVDIPMFSATGTPTASNFLRGDNTWATPAGSGDMVLADAQTNTGIKTFLDTSMKLRNVANTFDGFFVNTNTADRIYTLQNAAGTLAFVTRTVVGITGTKAQFDTAVTDGDILYVGDVTSNVPTSLTLGTITATTIPINSDGSSPDITLAEATTTLAGLLGADKWDEIVANTLKNTNVSTDLSMGTVSGTQYTINSSDGNNVNLPLADTNNWGIISDEIFDEIVANNAKVGFLNLTGHITSTGAATLLGSFTLAQLDVALGTTGTADATTFLRGDNSWATPGGSGDMILASVQTITGAKTFDAATLLLNDTDSAFDLELGSTSTITTANKTLTFDVNDANRTITVSGDTTISGNNTGGNTGDETSIVGIGGTKAQFNTEVSDGTILYVGDITSNVTTNLSFSVAPTTVTVISSDGTDAVLPEANTTNAGILGSDKWDEIVANTAKVTNVSTNLSMGTVDGTQYNVNSSDGTNVALPLADTNNWGIISDEIFDEIVANNAKVSNIVQTATLTAGVGLAGTTYDPDTASTLSLDFSELTDMTGAIAGTTELILQDGTAESRKAANEIILSVFDDDIEKSKSITIESPGAAEDISMYFTNKAITITEMRAVLIGSATPSVTWTIRHGTDRNATGAEVVTSGTVTTSTTTGSDVTSFNDATIVLDSFVWFETTAQSGTVGEISITLVYTED